MKKFISLFIHLAFPIICTNAQGVGIGTSTPTPSTVLDVNSVTGAFLLPRMNTAQRNALTPSEGMVIYNAEYSRFQGYGLVSETIDQFQTTFSNFCTGTGCGSKWQSFQCSFPGYLTSVKLLVASYVGCLPTTVTVKIHSGTGIAGPVLQTNTFTLQTPGSNQQIIPFHILLTVNAIYTIEFVSPSTGCHPGGDNMEWGMNNMDLYSAGHAFCCSELMNQDFVFTTYIGTFGWVNLY